MLRFLRKLLLMEVLIATTVVGIFAATLLNRLAYYQERAEKANMELVISSVRSSLRMHLASMMIKGHAMRYEEVADANPMDWLDQKPGNYRGLLPATRKLDDLQGNWFYDPASKSLLYWVKHGEHFLLDSEKDKKIRLRVILLYQNRKAASGETKFVTGVRLVPVEPYRWF